MTVDREVRLAAARLMRTVDTFALAAAFLTRVPVPHRLPVQPADFARSHAVFPVIGAGIGATVGATLWLLVLLRLPPLAAAATALGAGAMLTGGLHEDGLADTFDGLGGGRDRDGKLDIMRDSRLGSYGAIALTLSLLVKAATLAAMPPAFGIAALVFAHAASRSAASCAAAAMQSARPNGLGTFGRPSARVVFASVTLSLVIGAALLPLTTALVAVVAVSSVGGITAASARRQIGGQTGDVLGAIQQLSELTILAVCAGSVAS